MMLGATLSIVTAMVLLEKVQFAPGEQRGALIVSEGPHGRVPWLAAECSLVVTATFPREKAGFELSGLPPGL